jgi:hypothetical protein
MSGSLRFRRAALLCALVWSTAASASPSASDKAAAQALFDDAIKLMARKSYAPACSKLEDSQRLDPAMGTRFQLAQCYEAIGRTASAWALFLEVADLARAAGQQSREKVARERASGLEPKVSHLVIDGASSDVTGFEVRLDDVVLGPAQAGTAIPVDPGTHRIRASARGKVGWAGEAAVSTSGATVHVEVPPLVDERPATVETEPSPAPSPAAPVVRVETPPAPPKPTPVSHAQRTLGVILTGGGALGVGASVVLGLLARSQYASVGTNCNAAGCNLAGKQTTDSARRLGDVGTGVFVAGAALAAGGIVVWLTAPSVVASPAMALRVGPGSVGLDGHF